MKEFFSDHMVALLDLKNTKNHRLEVPLSSTSVQHCTGILIKTDKYKLARFQPRNSVLKPIFAEKLCFFNTYSYDLNHPKSVGNNPMVGATVAVAVAVQEAMTK